MTVVCSVVNKDFIVKAKATAKAPSPRGQGIVLEDTSLFWSKADVLVDKLHYFTASSEVVKEVTRPAPVCCLSDHDSDQCFFGYIYSRVAA